MNLPPSSAAVSRASSGVSRLAMMQARFQAQQIVEREQKLIHLLEDRQEETIRRIAYNNRDSAHSANSLSSANSNSTGSYNSARAAGQLSRSAVVRSADVHNSPIGWDKSYPLRPMNTDPGLPPTEMGHGIVRTPSMGLYKRNSTVGLSNMSNNKYSGGYGLRGNYINRNRGLSLDRMQANRYNGNNPGSLQTSPTRRPSYGITRTRSQAHILGHSSGEDSYASSSRPPSTYDTYSRHEVNLNRSNSHLYGSRNGNMAAISTVDFIDATSPPSPPGNRKTSYTREYVRNLPTTVSVGHVASAPASRGRLTRRQPSLRDPSPSRAYEHSSYSSQSSEKSETGIYAAPSFSIAPPTAEKLRLPLATTDYSEIQKPRINSQTYRKSRSPGKRSSRSPSRSPFGSDENDRVNNNEDSGSISGTNNSAFLQQQQNKIIREREEEKRRLQAEMRRREQELLAKIKEQQRELENMKQEKGKVERELHRQELLREKERSKLAEVEQERIKFETMQRLKSRQMAVSRSSSSATSSSASKPDPDDEVDDEEEEPHQHVVGTSRQQRPPLKPSMRLTNSRLTSQSPAVPRRNRIDVEPPSDLSRIRAKSEARAARVEPKREPLTLSSLRAAAGNSNQPPPPAKTANNNANKKQPVQASLSNASSVSSPTKIQPTSKSQTHAQKSQNTRASMNKKAVNGGSNSVRSRLAPKARDDLVPCGNCGRNFAEDRIEKHQDICYKTAKKKRKVFDMTKKRVEGTEAENFALKKTRGGRANQQAAAAAKEAAAAGKKKGDWRKKRAEFIAALRAAKEAQRHLAAGGKLSDLPPPPPSDTSDYVQCPHCGRRFNEGVAERHIPKCKNIISNKKR